MDGIYKAAGMEGGGSPSQPANWKEKGRKSMEYLHFYFLKILTFYTLINASRFDSYASFFSPPGQLAFSCDYILLIAFHRPQIFLDPPLKHPFDDHGKLESSINLSIQILIKLKFLNN